MVDGGRIEGALTMSIAGCNYDLVMWKAKVAASYRTCGLLSGIWLLIRGVRCNGAALERLHCDVER